MFWTGHPEALWVPPCAHLNKPWSLKDDIDVLDTCEAMPQIWDGIMKLTNPIFARRRVTLTLVNSGAIPPGSYRKAPAYAHSTPSPKSYLQNYLRQDRFTMRFITGSTYRYPLIRLPTMQAWIRDGNADDVFTPRELAPFITASD